MRAKLTVAFVIFNIGYAFNKSGICFEKNVIGKNDPDATTASFDQFCCDFYEERNGTCVKCRDGFESNGGNPCIPCSLNTYGKFCVEKCDCGIYQRCHHVEGCVRRSKTDSITDLGSVRTWTSATTTELSSTDIQHGISRDFPMYLALGIGGISINMVLCIMCVVSYKRKRHSNDIISNENAAMDPIEDANIQEHAYDDIDENAIMADITNHGVVINKHIKEYLVIV